MPELIPRADPTAGPARDAVVSTALGTTARRGADRAAS